MIRQAEYAGGNGPLSREENALRKMAGAPPLIRARILRHFGRVEDAEVIERRHLSPEDSPAYHAEVIDPQGAAEDNALRERLNLAAQTV
jgi:hypothetical protein